MHRIAIFSDVHANLPALNAVLEDIDAKKPEAIYCLGDLVDFAPWPNEVIDTIRQRYIPTLMGNHDERIAHDLRVTPLAKHSLEEQTARAQAIEYTRKVITEENKKYLGGLPKQLQLSFGGAHAANNILLVHASTRSIDEYVYEEHPQDDLIDMFRDNQVNAIVMGHTHYAYIRSLDTGDMLAVNTGSVGRSKEKMPFASYLMLSITDSQIRPELVRVPYPISETIHGIRKSEVPNFYAEFLLASTRATKSNKHSTEFAESVV